MHPLYDEFIKYLEMEDKQKTVRFALDKLEKREIDVLTLYNKILKPSLNGIVCEEGDETCIWKEHIRTSIVRTIVESCYSYIIKEIKEKGIKMLDKKVLIFCPSDEYHEIGSRMIADFFTLVGFEVVFIGANTPRDQVGSAIEYFQPHVVAISVSNYFHLVEAGKAIKIIKEKYDFKGKIIVGGNAFYSNPKIFKRFGADLMLRTFEDIKHFAEGF